MTFAMNTATLHHSPSQAAKIRASSGSGFALSFGLVTLPPLRFAADTLVEHGGLKRGYLGLAGQPASLPESQRGEGGRAEALLIVGVTPGGPAAAAGLLVGDLLLDFDGQVLSSPEDLLDLLTGTRVGRQVPLRVQRGGKITDVTVTVGERPTH